MWNPWVNFGTIKKSRLHIKGHNSWAYQLMLTKVIECSHGHVFCMMPSTKIQYFIMLSYFDAFLDKNMLWGKLQHLRCGASWNMFQLAPLSLSLKICGVSLLHLRLTFHQNSVSATNSESINSTNAQLVHWQFIYGLVELRTYTVTINTLLMIRSSMMRQYFLRGGFYGVLKAYILIFTGSFWSRMFLLKTYKYC